MVKDASGGFNQARMRFLWLAALAVCSFLDYHLGAKYHLSFLYALVALLAGWTDGVRGAVVCTCLAIGVNLTSASLGHADSDFSYWADDLAIDAQWVIVGLAGAYQHDYLRRLAAQHAELKEARDRIKGALEDARRLQLGLLTARVPDNPFAEGSVRFDVAAALGGDFYDVRARDGGLAICLADVSGKGPPAALVVAMLRGLMEEILPVCAGPADLLARIQARLAPYLPDSMFVTCFAAFYQASTATLAYCNAGHDSPWVRAEGRLVELSPTGLPLGVAPELPLDEGRQRVGPGDLLLAYTDGLTNAPTPDGGRLGEEPVRRAVEEFAEGDLESLSDHIFQLAPSLANHQQDDDVVVLALRFK